MEYLGQLLYNRLMPQQDRIYIEFLKIGNSVKVSAICERTGREVCIVGDPKASKATLERIAVNKLRRVMENEAAGVQARKRGITI